MSRLRHAARRADGFTVPEMMIAMTIAMIVSLAAFSLIEFTMHRTGEIHGRVQASQQGRAAMDTMTRQLRSQVCLSSTVPPIAAANVSRVAFYVDLTDGSTGAPPELHTLTYDPASRQLRQEDFVGAGIAPAIIYPGLPTRKKMLLENVVPYRPAGAPADLPTFRFFAYDNAVPPRPTLVLPAPLSAADLGRVARIEIAYRTLRPNVKTTMTRGSIVLQDEVYVRAADPNDPAPTPTCA